MTSKLVLVPVTGILLAYDGSDAVAPASVYELFVGTIVLFIPSSTMVGDVLSIIMLEPFRFVAVNVLLVVLSSLYAVMVNPRLVVSASDEFTT